MHAREAVKYDNAILLYIIIIEINNNIKTRITLLLFIINHLPFNYALIINDLFFTAITLSMPSMDIKIADTT